MDTKVSEPAVTIDAVPGKPQRRRFSPEFKQRIVEEVLQGRDSVSVIARRHDINTNQLFTWKRQYQNNADNYFGQPNLLPIQVKASPESGDGKCTLGRIDIVLHVGRRISVQGEVSSATLRTVLEVLSR